MGKNDSAGMTLLLNRFKSTDQGTQGVLIGPGFMFCTLELPWRDNAPNLSCIPPGDYQTELIKARRSIAGRQWLYFVKNVQGRSGILIHAGNFAGDPQKGLKRNSWGCPLLGLSHGVIDGQAAVLNSRLAVAKFHEHMQGKPVTLSIRDNYYA